MSKRPILAYWLMFLMAVGSSALGQAASGDGIGKPLYATRPVVRASGSAAQGGSQAKSLTTLPFWRGGFQFAVKGKGQVFPYTMVGTDPALASTTTLVATNIVPVSLSFSSGARLDGSTLDN